MNHDGIRNLENISTKQDSKELSPRLLENAPRLLTLNITDLPVVP